MKTWERIIIHCSDSSFGSASMIRKWHEARGWTDIGYHFVVSNGHIESDLYIPQMAGNIEVGRLLDGDARVDKGEQGAHVLGHNDDAIGICLIGKQVFEHVQLDALVSLIKALQIQYNISAKNVLGHYELDSLKSCPNIAVVKFRGYLYE